MKTRILFSLLIALILLGCDSKPDEFIPNDYRYILKGNCSYVEAVSGNTITTNANISIKIRYKNSNEVLPIGSTSSVTGSSYEFGPLKPETYIITAEYLDNTSMILYRTEEEVSIVEKSVIKDLVLQGSANTVFLKGSITYTNIITGMPTAITSGLTGTITSVDDMILLPNNGNASVNGNTYTFGPLLSKRYELKFSYTDSYGQKYSDRDTVDLNTSTGPLIFKDYQLTWEPSTVLITTVTDSLNNPVAGTEVYLYNNYLFLKQYKANASAAIANSVTNSNGIAIFTNLNPIRHFRYALKKIGNDTLSNFDTTFVPSSELPLIQNQINYRTDIVKYAKPH
ncbi:MAG: hypothetical protein V4677_00670 [Bacteroidota bacterium]